MSAGSTEVPSFRQTTLGDAPAILDLLEAAFERWPAFDISVPALEHLLWKMQPPGIEPNHTVGEIDGQIIVLELRWMGPATLDGREVITNDGVDMAVHPDFQSRGFSRLINDAPSRTPDVIEGRELSCEIVRLDVGRRGRSDDADRLGDRRQRPS